MIHDVASAWREIREWPPNERLVLATRILQSLAPGAETTQVSEERKEALQRLIGVWSTENPPSDEDVEKIIEQERMKKYG